jgi:antitoxin PrlF
MALTSKGQITIPKDVRDRLGLKPGDNIFFFAEDGKLAGYPVHKRDIMELAGTYKSGVPYVSKEAEREAIGRYLAEKQRRILETGHGSEPENVE